MLGREDKFDVMRWWWAFLLAIVVLAGVIVLYKESPFTVSCKVGRAQPEQRLFFPLTTDPSNQLANVVANSKIKSYRNVEPRTDRYFLCHNTSLSVKLRYGTKLEIKMKEPAYSHPETREIEYWSKASLQTTPEPTWASVTHALESCEHFAWIPETGACYRMATVDTIKRVSKQRLKMVNLDPRLRSVFESCIGGSAENHAASIEYSLVEIVVHTLDGPKTIGRFNSLTVEDGPAKTIRCAIQALRKYTPEGEVSMSYPEFLLQQFRNYRVQHFEELERNQ